MVSIKGGEKAVAALQKMAQRVSAARSVRVGFLEGSTYPDGTSIPMVAAIHNFGAPAAGIPPRPFLSNVVARGKKQWPKQVASLLKNNDYDASATLTTMGEGIKGQIQTEITKGSFTPLKPATVKRKGFAKPLIDTSTMLNSVAYEVK